MNQGACMSQHNRRIEKAMLQSAGTTAGPVASLVNMRIISFQLGTGKEGTSGGVEDGERERYFKVEEEEGRMKDWRAEWKKGGGGRKERRRKAFNRTLSIYHVDKVFLDQGRQRWPNEEINCQRTTLKVELD